MVGDLSPEEGLAKVAAAGFTQVELSCWESPVGKWWKDPVLMRRLLDAAGLCARSMHTPEAGWNIDDPDEAKRLASVEAAASVFGPAAAVGVEMAICHPNYSSRTFAVEDYGASVSRSIASLALLAERAAEAGLKLAVENLPVRGTPRPAGCVEEVLRMIEGLGSHVGLCVDAGHANANGRSAAGELRRASGEILAVHIHDNDGLGPDQHLIPGKGTADWGAFVRTLDEVAPACIRNFEVPPVDGKVDDTLAALAALRGDWEKR